MTQAGVIFSLYELHLHRCICTFSLLHYLVRKGCQEVECTSVCDTGVASGVLMPLLRWEALILLKHLEKCLVLLQCQEPFVSLSLTLSLLHVLSAWLVGPRCFLPTHIAANIHVGTVVSVELSRSHVLHGCKTLQDQTR